MSSLIVLSLRVRTMGSVWSQARVLDVVEWRCPEGDFQARAGDYLHAL